MNPVRVGFDARYINDRYHGIGRYAFNLLEALTRMARSVRFILFQGNGKDSRFDWRALAERPNVEIYSGPERLYWPTEQLAWPRLLKRQRLDIFHTPYFVAPVMSTANAHLVITVHDLIFDRYPQYMPKSWARPYYRSMMAASLWRAEQIISVSKATARDLAQFYPRANGKITIISEGVHAKFENGSDMEQMSGLRNKYHLKKPFILNVGARRPHKNLGGLVRAFSLTAPQIEHDLVLIGAHDERFPDEARLETERLQIQDRVHLIEWVPEDELPSIYQMADLVVLPSWIEGFGLPALEAIAGGTVVAATGNSVYSEILGEAGIYFDPTCEQDMAEAIMLGLNNYSLRQRLVDSGRSRSQRFTWEDAALKTLLLYDNLLT